MHTPDWRQSHRLPAFLAVLLLTIAIVRITATYHTLSQAYDEPADVVAGMEWLDKGTYTLNLEHPPLSTVASALGPFLAGLRLSVVPVIHSEQGPFFDLSAGGNNILYAGPDYWRTLTLARLSMLPFFALGVVVVFLWAREIAGEAAAVLAVLLFTTLPPILAFAGFAYTDLPVAVLVAASVFIFTRWLERPRLSTTVLLGVVTALAVLANFPALLFLPACWAAVACCWWWFRDKGQYGWRSFVRQVVWAALAFAIVLWAGYRFSVKPLMSIYPNAAQDINSLHVPMTLKHVLNGVAAVNPPVPAPPFFKGITSALRDTGKGRQSYLFGDIRSGGWWYFFLVVLAVKSPLPFLLLTMLGGAATLMLAWRNRQWRLLVPCISVFAVLLVTMPVKVNYGIRHILCVYPLLAMLAGCGAMRLWSMKRFGQWLPRITLVALLTWQVVSTSQTHPDYVTYFNELVGQHPESVLLWGCDYDCGQDTARLARLLRERKISRLALSVFTTADFARLGFPSFQILNPYQQTTGWVAASVRMIYTGDAFWGQSHPDGFRWLTSCKPIARAGKTIYLYHIPCDQPTNDLRPPQ